MTWYRSLYWRIGVGFIACLALLLVVQGLLFVWMIARAESTVPNQPPERFARAVAVDISQALERDATLDVEKFIRDEYEGDSQPFFVVLADGRTIPIGMRLPTPVAAEARARLDAWRRLDPVRLQRGLFGRGPLRGRGRAPLSPDDAQRPEPPDGSGPWPPMFDGPPRGGPGFGRGPRPEGPPPEFDLGPDGRPPDPDDRGPFPALRAAAGVGLRGARVAPIVAAGTVTGLVAVPPQPPFSFLLTRYAPTLVTVAVATLVIGGMIAAVAIFGPTRRRLKGVEEAARRLGGGDLTARAPSDGSDEVAAVATAFNAMAVDLAARTEALVEADRARRQLLADVSHELNTPVTAMRGYLETLSMPELGLDDATRARYLGIVGDETARLERIIGDLLDLARLEGGGGDLTLEPIATADLFERVRARHERTAESTQVTIALAIGPGAETIVADRTRFEQALQNLAANGLRYAPAGTALRLEAVRSGATVTITISDEGPGIPAAHLRRVFERFHKVEASRAAQANGSGLGLSIVKAIVERHGASIDVKSRPGQTVFTISGVPAPRTQGA